MTRSSRRRSSRRGARPAARPLLTARDADRHDLYQRSVQLPDHETRFLERVFEAHTGRRPLHLREDFCGTALLCARWVKSHPERTAMGLDTSRPTLEWGRAHNLSAIGAAATRVTLVEQDVLMPTRRKFDVIGAYNYSYQVFHERELLLRYFRAAHRSLTEDGLFVLDALGGFESTQARVERRRMPGGWTYIWEQERYDAVNARVVCHISFEFRDGTALRRCFTYDWRHYSLSELRDALFDAGFASADSPGVADLRRFCGQGAARRDRGGFCAYPRGLEMVSESSGRKLPVFVPNTASLVAPLLRHLPAAFVNIAPERADELQGICEGLSLAIVDDPKFVCHYTPATKFITISTGVIEVLWAASHAYIVLHARVIEQKHVTQPLVVDLHADRVVSDAMVLLKWGFNRFVENTSAAWPDQLLRPIESPPYGSPENAADELALCAVAFLLHHELAHHRLGHPFTMDLLWKLDQERDADYAAADWILQGVAEDDARFTKRALGIATALAVLAAYGVHTDHHDGETHPRSFDRLFHTLSRHIRDDYSKVWAFVVGILNLHMTNAGFTLPSVIHASFKSCVDSYVEILAEDAARAAS